MTAAAYESLRTSGGGGLMRSASCTIRSRRKDAWACTVVSDIFICLTPADVAEHDLSGDEVS